MRGDAQPAKEPRSRGGVVRHAPRARAWQQLQQRLRALPPPEYTRYAAEAEHLDEAKEQDKAKEQGAGEGERRRRILQQRRPGGVATRRCPE